MTAIHGRGVERGMTLLEMLLALTVFSVVMAGSLGFLRSQSRAFTLGTRRAAQVENLRFAVNLLAQDLRTVGAGVPDEQPFLVYAGPDVVAFNADYTTNVRNDRVRRQDGVARRHGVVRRNRRRVSGTAGTDLLHLRRGR